MTVKQILAIWYRIVLVFKTSPSDYFTIFFWPLVFVMSIGLFSTFITDPAAKIILLIGSIGWSYGVSSHMDGGFTFLRDIWFGSVKKLRTLPMGDFTLITANWSFGIFRSAAVITMTSLMAYVVFGFNFFGNNLLFTIALLFGVNLFALALSIFISTATLLIGHRADVIIYSVIDAVVLLSGVFYPISILPEVIQKVSLMLPLTYFFEALREMFLLNTINVSHLLTFYILDIVYIAGAWILFKRVEKRAREKGFYQMQN
jgi:ABC-2 type transport system permease protein